MRPTKSCELTARNLKYTQRPQARNTDPARLRRQTNPARRRPLLIENLEMRTDRTRLFILALVLVTAAAWTGLRAEQATARRHARRPAVTVHEVDLAGMDRAIASPMLNASA